MKGKLATSLLATSLLVGGPQAAQAANGLACSNASIKGDFGYVETGEVAGFGTSAEVGLIRVDGEGMIKIQSVLQTEALGPVLGPLNVSFEGTYDVEPNCVGSADMIATLETMDGSPIGVQPTTASFVLTRDDEIRFVVTSPGRVLSGVAKRTLRHTSEVPAP